MPSPDELEEVVAKEAIRTILNRFCRGVDRADRAALESVYHPDALFETYGGAIRPASKPVNEALEICPERYERMLHSLGTINIELSGDIAYTESYFTHSFVYRQRIANERLLRTASGRYLDRFEKRDGEWRIAHRTLLVEFYYQSLVAPFDQVHPEDGRDDYPMSEYGFGDPAYRRQHA